MDWFMAGITKGVFDVKNPYNKKIFQVPALPEHVHTIVFWSKDFTRFLEGGYGEKLRALGYNLFFNFTLNSRSPLIEPCIATTEARLKQAIELCRRFGARAVQWRFDPICFYRTKAGGAENNLHEFKSIARAMAGLGVSRCVTSFVDLYAKLGRRPLPGPGFGWIDPPVEKKIRVLMHMQKVLADLGISLYLCCEQEILDAMPEDAGILPGACIPGHYLAEIFGGSLSLQKDRGQRRQKGCGCIVSRDIGGYADQPCFHNCLYCYANPSPGK